MDIDPQAVEVTKLSLLLKVLEGEDEQTIARQLSMLQKRVLPDLGNNIKCGNSLIGPDFYEGRQMSFLDEEEMVRINAFDWEAEFAEIMQAGGFDAVIGNPPYLKLTLNNLDPRIAEYYSTRYQSLSGGSSKNLFQLFVERILQLQPKIFSFIVPESLLTTSSNKPLRLMMVREMTLSRLVVFDHFVFGDATIGSTIFVLATNERLKETTVEKLYPNGSTSQFKRLALDQCLDTWDTSSKNEFVPVLEKITHASVLMKELVEMSKGMVVKDRKNYLRSSRKAKDLPFLLGKSLGRYKVRCEHFANYDELTIVGGTRDLRKHVRTPRLLIRRTGDILCAAYSSNEELIESTLYILTSNRCDLKYLLGLLNSKLLTFYLKQKLITNVQGFPQILMGQLEQLPIRTINFADPTDQARHDRMVALVDRMLDLHKQLAEAKTPQTQTVLQRQIETTDRQIDVLVYELYELTEEEIKIVEESLG